jgi:hypothetical protein
MPKKSNPKKMAAQQFGKIKALDEAIKSGKYNVVKVDKAVGFCQFTGKVDLGRQLRDVLVLVRGKNKGGKNCATRVAPGCYVLTEGEPGKTMEIVGVVNRQAEVEQLRAGGRLSEALRNYAVEGAGVGTGDDLDDLFERGEEEGADLAGDAWGKVDEEREAQATELLARYQKKRVAAGGKTLEDDVLRGGKVAVADGSEEEDEDEAPPAEDAEGAHYAARHKPVTSKRRLRKLAEEAAAEAAAAAEGLGLADAAYWEEQRRLASLEEEAVALASRPVPDRWDADEVDIDAI